MDYKRAILRFVFRHVKKWMAPSAELGLEIKSITIDFIPSPDSVSFNVTYLITARTELRTPLTIDLSDVPIETISIHCPVAELVTMARGNHLLVLRLLPEHIWRDAEIMIAMRWPTFATDRLADPSPTVVLVPDALPRVAGAGMYAVDSAQPLVAVARIPRGSALRLVGVAGNESDREFLRLALIRNATQLECYSIGSGDVVFSNSLEGQLNTKERSLAVRVISTMKDFLCDEFGYDPQHDILLASIDDIRGPGTIPAGPWLITTRQHLGFGPDGARQDSSLAIQLASAWWGTGCRIKGSNSHELEFALRCAVGLRWTAFVGGAEAAEQNGARLSELTSPLTRFGVTRRLVDGWRPWVGAAIGRRLFAALNENPAARSVLRNLTRQAWGRTVSSDVIRQSFEQVGVDLN